MAKGGAKRARTPALLYARAVVFLRVFLVVGWAVGAVAAMRYVPPLETGSSVSGILSEASPAIHTELTSVKHFRVPLLAETVVVQHRASGLSSTAQIDTVVSAAKLDAHHPKGLERVGGAIPITNAKGLFPGSGQEGTTALTYLLFRPSVSLSDQQMLAKRYADRYLNKPRDALVGVTGSFVDENTQGALISDALPEVEVAALVLISVLVGMAFRSVAAPVLTLATAGIAYVVSQAALELATQHLGVNVPSEIGPIIDVLLLGLATDYTVFFLAGFRDDLVDGKPRAIVSATASIAPLVLIAGVTVAAGVGATAVAHLTLFSDLAPGLAITVVVTCLVALTFVPAALAILGKAAYWPRRPGRQAQGEASPMAAAGRSRGRLTRVVVQPLVAVVIVVIGTGALVMAARPVRHATIALNLLGDLPSTSTPVQAARAAASGFVPGIIAPTLVLVNQRDVAHHKASLDKLQGLLRHERGVATVLGPSINPTSHFVGLFVATGGDYARYLVIFNASPYGAAAISDLRGLQERMPALLHTTGLSGAVPAFAGDTTVASEISRTSRTDLLRVGALALVINLLILVVFLRSLVVPFLLVAASALVVLASFGLTAWVFHGHLGTPGFTFFVPVAVEVLLISFGADYNLFLVGRIWEMAATRGHRALRPVISEATAAASAPINVAGITLAGCFAMLAIIDLNSFREFTFAMVVGLLLDTFLVRFFIVPALLSLLGRSAGWPSHRLATPSVTGDNIPPPGPVEFGS